MAKKVKKEFIGSTYRNEVLRVGFVLTGKETKDQLEIIENYSPNLLEDVKSKRKEAAESEE